MFCGRKGWGRWVNPKCLYDRASERAEQSGRANESSDSTATAPPRHSRFPVIPLLPHLDDRFTLSTGSLNPGCSSRSSSELRVVRSCLYKSIRRHRLRQPWERLTIMKPAVDGCASAVAVWTPALRTHHRPRTHRRSGLNSAFYASSLHLNSTLYSLSTSTVHVELPRVARLPVHSPCHPNAIHRREGTKAFRA